MNQEVSESPYPRLLIVDDQAAIHSDFGRILDPEADPEGALELEATLFGSTAGQERVEVFEIEHAYQGAEALEMVEASVDEGRRFSVAFVDMRMPPGWDGLETILRIWQVDPDIEIVICSAFSDHSRGELLARLGHTDRFVILNKPFDPSEVVQLASSLSRKWYLARETALSMQRLQETIDDLKASNDELERVGYVASHHLQEPLRKISEICGLLQREYADQLPEDAGSWFRSVLDSSAQARQLITDLREYSQARALPVCVQRFNLAEAAHAAIEELAEQIAECGAQIEVGPLPDIDSDPNLWRVVLLRVLENSLRFRGPKPPVVELTTVVGDPADILRVAIKDNGIGIAARFEESVFMLFQRLHTRNEYPGSGAGLAICRRVLARLGSQIWLESEVGVGTTVHIAIPRPVSLKP